MLSGCAVTAQGSPDMTCAVASGIVRVATSFIPVASGNVTITTADATNPRIDLVVVNNAGAKSVTAGTAAASPKAPDIPANSILLAMVYVPANDTTIASNQITDKRVLTPLVARMPLSSSYVQDDFVGGSNTTGNIGQLGWSFAGGTASNQSPIAGRVGVFRRQTSATISTNSYTTLRSSATTGVFLASELFDMRWSIRLNSNDANTQVRCGLFLDASANPPTDGIYVEKLDADTNWFTVCRAASTQTRTDSGVAVSTNFIDIRIRRIDASTIGFTVGTAAEQTVTTNLTALEMLPTLEIINSSAVNKTIDIDYFDMLITGLAR